MIDTCRYILLSSSHRKPKVVEDLIWLVVTRQCVCTRNLCLHSINSRHLESPIAPCLPTDSYSCYITTPSYDCEPFYPESPFSLSYSLYKTTTILTRISTLRLTTFSIFLSLSLFCYFPNFDRTQTLTFMPPLQKDSY